MGERMKQGKNGSRYPAKLRKRVEALLNTSPSAVKKMKPRNILNLIEDLHIHLIEFEMKNEVTPKTQTAPAE